MLQCCVLWGSTDHGVSLHTGFVLSFPALKFILERGIRISRTADKLAVCMKILFVHLSVLIFRLQKYAPYFCEILSWRLV
jgi:hypothetical protein